jgi:hypothetical protein
VLVHGTLDIGRDGTGALVENTELGKVVEQPCNAHLFNIVSLNPRRENNEGTHALLLSSTQDILPLLAGVESTLTIGKVGEVDVFENVEQLGLRSSRCDIIRVRVGVDDPTHDAPSVSLAERDRGGLTDPSRIQH